MFVFVKVDVDLRKPLNNMIEVKGLRLGNLIVWNPKLCNPQVTLQPMTVEIAVITPKKIGYTPYKLEQRVEPFEDDLMVEMETVLKSKEEFEAIKLSIDILERSGFENNDGAYHLKGFKLHLFLKNNIWFATFETASIEIEIRYLHQLQNLYFTIVGEELEILL
jgi:hypothetical protein